jgi:tetratricopeptide (TPR) repeat protein
MGHLDVASAEADRAAELEPLEWINPLFSALIHLRRGELAQSAEMIDRSEKISKKRVDFQLRVELLHALSSNDRERARRILIDAHATWPSGSSNLLDVMNEALASKGNDSERPAQLRRALDEIQKSGRPTDHIGLVFAAVAIFLEQKEVALDALWFDFNSPSGLDSALMWTPVFKPLWPEPKFLELVRAMKMPEYWRVAGWSDVCRPKGDNGFECVAK